MKTQQLAFMAALFTFALVLNGCSSDNKTVDSKTAEAIDVSEYFPPIGMTREYTNYDTDGNSVASIDTVNLSTNSDGTDTVYIHEKGVASEAIKEYIVSKEEVKLVYLINSFGNAETAVVELANKPEWDKNDASQSVSRMTATGLTMEVPAGKYDHVIEITSVIPGDKEGKTLNYYAPEVGLIKTVFSFKDGEEFIFNELKSAKKVDNTASVK
ncbi:hypothetical protein MHZ92_11805 [Sporosarcina sp. ACRSL]|uniref:hypothetical protein n=1 Tax=Sporosarcina sp. ACRSL TaxID=2918215 RepID=UPI001EF6E370|nr:hypothetical protein [Sporosarcina sp. ACRSL]MCG7344821.1 hypothetical protein [Sporosarcina sp. ACRSL]